MIIAVVPKTPPEGRAGPGKMAVGKSAFPMKRFIPLVLAFMMYTALYMISVYYVSFYLEETKLGGTSLAGIISAVGTASGFLAGLTFTLVYMKIKKATPAIFILLTAVAYLMLALSANIWLAGIAYFICSAAYITLNSYYFMYATTIVPAETMTIAMAILNAAMSIGGFLCSYIFDAYQSVFSTSSITTTYSHIGVTLLIGSMLSAVLFVRSRKIIMRNACRTKCNKL